MIRIRYTKDQNGCLVSTSVFVSGETDLQAYIMPDGKTGAIVDSSTGTVVFEKKATSLHKIKIALKRFLEENHVTFKKETRSK